MLVSNLPGATFSRQTAGFRQPGRASGGEIPVPAILDSRPTVKAPKSSKELFERAQAQHRAGRVKEAESLYRQVISRNPEHEPALFALSVLYFETGRFADASRYLERLVAKRPDEPVLLTNLGEAYRRQGALDRAAAAFERILGEHPEFPEAHQNLGIVLMDAGAPNDALEWDYSGVPATRLSGAGSGPPARGRIAMALSGRISPPERSASMAARASAASSGP